MANVLIMEDDLTLRHELADGLRDCGHVCDCTGSVPEAMASLKDAAYDIVITDIYILKNGQLSPEGGVSLIGWMRTFKYRRGPLAYMGDMPVIAISGAANISSKEYILHMAVNIGATMAMRKPIAISDLDGHIQRLTARPVARSK